METSEKLFKATKGPAIVTALLLLVPLSAKLLTDEMAWTLSDFIFAGVLIFSTGLTYILVTRVLAPRMGDSIVYRVAVGFALFTGLFLIWVNGAVGIIGSEDNTINALYFGVIFIGIIGAFIARFKPKGMSLTMYGMAITQAIIAIIALFNGMAGAPGSSVYEILAVNGFFITLFVVSAILFRYAVQKQPSDNATQEG